MYGISQSPQLFIFFGALGLGFLIGILYDLLRGIRLSISRGKALLIAFDILFLTLSGLSTFIYCLAFCQGAIRFYVIFGEITGYIFYYFSFGIAAIKLTDFLVRTLRTIYHYIFKVISAPFKLIYKLLVIIKSKMQLHFKKSTKNSEKIKKKHLPKLRLYVYNLFGVLFTNRKSSKKGGSDNGKTIKEKEKKSVT